MLVTWFLLVIVLVIQAEKYRVRDERHRYTLSTHAIMTPQNKATHNPGVSEAQLGKPTTSGFSYIRVIQFTYWRKIASSVDNCDDF